VLQRIVDDGTDAFRVPLAEKIVGAASARKSERLIAVLVEESDAEKRLAAAKELRRVGLGVGNFDRLVELVKSADFGDRGNREINAVFGALRKVGGQRAIAVLSELAKTKKKLFGGGKTARVRVLAVNWLQNAQTDRQRKKKNGR
jgi:hypothetical protein